MSIRLNDVLFYAGGECLERFGVPVWSFNRRQRAGPVFTRASVGQSFDRDGVLRISSADRQRIEWVDDEPMILVESARTNVVLWSRDLTNAAWTKTNCTAAKDQTGIDGVASSASKITASAGNATCLQAITLASSARYQSCYVKRVTGSGTINMTMDNGSTWTAVTVTSAWTRVTIPTQTLANPTVGFRIVTNGDAIAIDFVQNENGAAAATSPIATTTVAVTRAADMWYAPIAFSPQEMTVYVRFDERGTADISVAALFIIGNSNGNPNMLAAYASGTPGRYVVEYATAVTSSAATLPFEAEIDPGESGELRVAVSATGIATIGISVEGAAEVTEVSVTPAGIPAAWALQRLYLGSIGATNHGVNPIASILVVAGTRTMAEMREVFA